MAYRKAIHNMISGEFDPFTADSTQKHPLGKRVELEDGRVFRYAECGGTGIAVGKLCQTEAPVANHTDMACDTAAIGATTVTATDGGTAFTANEYAEGFLHVNGDTGEGYVYKIKSHPANAGSASCVFTLYDPIKVALGASATVTVTKNKYKDLIICPTTMTGVAVGTTPTAVTADYFFWLQTAGPAVCLFHTGSGGAAAIGGCVCPSTTNTPVAGAVEEADADNLLPVVGTVLHVNATTEHGLIDLCCE